MATWKCNCTQCIYNKLRWLCVRERDKGFITFIMRPRSNGCGKAEKKILKNKRNK